MAETKPRGRPKARNAEDTKARILEAATIEFSRLGYDGARVDKVAKAAQVNINSVYHYFSNKENLFISVMEHAYEIIRSHHKDMELRELHPIEAMTLLVTSSFHMFVDHPEVIGLLASENMHEARHIRRSQKIQRLYHPLLDIIEETLERGAKAGIFREGVDPVDLFVSINAEGYFYLSNRHTLGIILNRDMLAPERLAHHEAHIVEVILSYLVIPGAERP